MTATAAVPLPERRAAVVARITAAEETQGAALLDGQDADASGLLALHGELAVIDAAGREADRREREAAEAEATALYAEARQEAGKGLAAVQEALTAAQAHAEALAASLGTVLTEGERLIGLVKAMGGRPPSSLTPRELSKLLSIALGDSLDGLDTPRSFGYLDWPSSFGGNWERLGILVASECNLGDC